MKNLLKKSISIIIVLILAFGGMLTGCNEQQNSPNIKANTRERKAQVHVYNMTETADYLVKNGMSD